MMSFAPLGVTNVIFREIGKFEKLDRAVFQGHEVSVVKPNDPVDAIVTRHAKNPNPTKNGPWPNQKHSELSVKINDGNNLYLIKLDPETRAVFAAGTVPIMVLPPELGSGILENISLAYVEADELRLLPAANIAASEAVPPQAMLAFTCDRAKMEQVWASAMPQGHTDIAVKIPFYLNLYDAVTKKPVWTFGAPRCPFRPAALDHRLVETHGGIHPSGDPHGDDHVHIVTHGGIHPSTPSQLLY